MDSARDIDVFVLPAEAGSIYQLLVMHGSLTDSQLRLVDQDGITELGFNDDRDTSSTEAELYYRANSDRQVFIEVFGFGSSTGTYQLIAREVEDDHGHLPADATAIELDGTSARTKSGDLFAEDIDLFSFLARKNAFYRVETSLGSLDDSMLRLLHSDGERELARNDDSSASTLASTLIWQAPQDGRYFIEVSGVGKAVGDYTVNLRQVSDPIDDFGNRSDVSSQLSIGTDIAGNVNYQGDEDWFRFEATKDSTYVFDVALQTLEDSILRVFDGDGRAMLAENDDIEYPDRRSRIEWRSDNSGVKYVVVSGFDGHAGSYMLQSDVKLSKWVSGDLDMNGVVEAADIDHFFASVRQGVVDDEYDLNGDGVVNSLDSRSFVTDVIRTLPGDTNLDHRIDFHDFLAMAHNFDRSGGWLDGDADGDGWVGFEDFLLLSTNFGLEV